MKIAEKITILNSEQFHGLRVVLGQTARFWTSCLFLIRRPSTDLWQGSESLLKWNAIMSKELGGYRITCNNLSPSGLATLCLPIDHLCPGRQAWVLPWLIREKWYSHTELGILALRCKHILVFSAVMHTGSGRSQVLEALIPSSTEWKEYLPPEGTGLDFLHVLMGQHECPVTKSSG